MSIQTTSAIVPRETISTLEDFVDLLRRWNRRINLFSRKEDADLWSRHVLDSAQLLPLASESAQTWLDIGSGGGFPGIICAIIAKHQGRPVTFTLVESDQRKAAFLREAVIRFQLPVSVFSSRIEDMKLIPQDIISARALAPLEKLLSYAYPFSHSGTTFLFPKGRQNELELTEARVSWHMRVIPVPSRTDAEGSILRISEVSRRS